MGLSGSLTHTTSVTLVVNPPPQDFTLSASPSSQTVVQGNGTSFGISITPVNGFTGSVSLSTSGLPTGATGTFTPSPATGTSSLAITTMTNTPSGTYPLTMIGLSGSLTHTASVTLVVNAGPP
jgi:hypothetical protein